MDKVKTKTNEVTSNLIPHLPGLIFWKNKQGIYQGCNENFATFIGYENINDIVGKTDDEIFHADYVAIIQANEKEVIEHGQEIITEEITKFKNSDKSEAFIISRKPLLDSNKKIIGIVANLVNCTSQLQTIEDLNIEKDKIELAYNQKSYYIDNIVKCTPGYIYWKDKNGVYLGANESWMKLTNLTSLDQVIGKKDEDVFGIEEAKALRENDQRVMESGETIEIEESTLMPNGDTLYFMAAKMPLRDSNNEVIGVIGNSLDITQLKRLTYELEQAKIRAEVANRAKSEFLAVVSHELRIPLTSILGMTHYLSTKQMSTEQQAEYIQNTANAAKHLLTLVNDLLDFAKLEAGKFELVPAPLDLKAMLEEATTMLAHQAKIKGLDLLVNYTQKVPHKILGDSRALRQAIINLVGNAIKFTERGYVLIKVDCIERSDTHALLELVIEDTGIGIAPDKLELIFDHFQQADSSFTRKYSGTGLGLAITKKLLDLMNGTIEVTSTLNKGSIFRCVINFMLQSEAIIEQPWVRYQAQVRILIVDDSLRGDVIRKQISPSNCQVISSNGALNTFVALQQFGNPYHIVIIDYQLREADPFKLAGMINEQQGLQKPMLLLLLPQESFLEKEKARKKGFFDCMVSPIQPIEFQSSLTAAWERWMNHEKISVKDNKSALRILVVEDEQMVLLIHTNFLRDLGHQVDVAKDGKEALEKLKNEYDIIFLDIGLPDISGDEVARIYRENEANGEHLPIVALTAYGSLEHQQKFFSAGIDEVMIKPVTQDQMADTIKKFCPILESA